MNKNILKSVLLSSIVASVIVLTPFFIGANEVSTQLVEVAAFPHRPTGIAVAEDSRVFVSLPFSNYSDPEKFTASLVEISEDNKVSPYPDTVWNRNPSQVNNPDPASLFFNVQSHTIDEAGVLWALDRGRPLGEEVIVGGAKLVGIDLKTNEVIKIIPFDSSFAISNLFNDIRVDAKRQIAYITDTNNGGIIVVDLNSGKQRWGLKAGNWMRFTQRNPVAQGVEIDMSRRTTAPLTADGLALSPDNQWLYLQGHPRISSYLYRVPTEALRNTSLTSDEVARQVELVAETVFSDGIQTDAEGRVYFTDFENDAISRIDPQMPSNGVEIIVSDPEISWPDAIDFAPDGTLYFTVAQFHHILAGDSGIDRSEPPFKVFMISKS